MREVSESLAGRLALVELTPFLFNELAEVPLGRLWCRGGYPDGGVLGARRFPHWQRDYVTLLAQRDLPAWGLPARPEVTLRFLRMLAALQGQVWNASQLGQALGLSHHTVNTYLDYLVGAFLVRRLPPFHANLGKRLVKSPKVYLRDSGLLHALLNVRDEDELLQQPWVGASFEGFVIEQVLGLLGQRGSGAEAFFLRTSDQKEIDLVLDFGRARWAIEVKLTASPGPADLDRLDAVADLIGAHRRILISRTKEVVAGGRRVSTDLAGFERLLDEIAPRATGR
jgi:predicted AAA+ superfamily ATPase